MDGFSSTRVTQPGSRLITISNQSLGALRLGTGLRLIQLSLQRIGEGWYQRHIDHDLTA